MPSVVVSSPSPGGRRRPGPSRWCGRARLTSVPSMRNRTRRRPVSHGKTNSYRAAGPGGPERLGTLLGDGFEFDGELDFVAYQDSAASRAAFQVRRILAAELAVAWRNALVAQGSFVSGVGSSTSSEISRVTP